MTVLEPHTAGAPTAFTDQHPGWTLVARLADLRGDGPFAVSADGLDLVLVRGATGFRAYQGRCPHQGALLGEGELDGDTLICRNHRWEFDIASGRRRGGAQCLVACPVEARGTGLWVNTAPVRAADRPPEANATTRR